MKKAVKIQIVYDDGSQDLATEDSATQIVDWLFGCQGMATIHGFIYDGPQFTTVPPVKQNSDLPPDSCGGDGTYLYDDPIALD